MSKTSRREKRRERVKTREADWVKDYERKQGKALGDPSYKLPKPHGG